MKRFRFDDLWIVSKAEQRGRGVSFHPRRNLLVGNNHTGKSTLIKTLFTTLGATPTGKLAKWDRHAASAVRFSVDDTQYRAVHENGRRGLFDDAGTLIHVTTSGAAWSKILSDVLGFNLTLTNKKENTPTPADAGSFFLPFYIDQDSSWAGGWDTFKSINQFKSPVQDILNYFSGIRPPEYYKAKALFDETKAALAELAREFSFLAKARDRIGARLVETGPKMESKNFEAEVARLTQEMTRLNAKQEKLRKRATQEWDMAERLSRQIGAANAALKEYEGDSKFLRTRSNEPLVCPVCQAEHQESYLDLLAFADDARSLRSLTAEFSDDRRTYLEQLRKTNDEIKGLDADYRRIEEILNVRRGDLQFRQVVESRGAEQAFAALEQESVAIRDAIGIQEVAQTKLRAQMDEWTNRTRTQSILGAFKSAYATALHDLNMPIEQAARLSSRPQVSGSGGPRAVLAYYSALWSVCLAPSGAFGTAIVVDSPNQQGQDGNNLPKVLEYVSTKLPGDGQVILGSELEVDHEFDKRIVLDQQYQVLRSSEFSAACEEVDGALEALYTT